MASNAAKPRPSIVTRWLKGLAVHFISMFLSIVAFSLIVSFFTLGVGTAIIWVGIPILVFTLGLSHVYAQGKKRLAVWQGAESWEDLPSVPRESPWWRRMLAHLRTPERWREFLYALFGSLFDFILAVIGVSFFVGAAGEFVSLWGLGAHGIVESLVTEGILGTSGFAWFLRMVGDGGIGIILLVLAFPVVWVCSVAQIGLTRVFLAPSRRAMEERLNKVERAKASGELAELHSFARIERDLHDGPQQRLIRSGIDLAALDRRLCEGDVGSARSLITDLRSRNDETLAEIRSLSRGFAPPVLSEKGLGDAIVSLAAVSAVPTTVSVDLPARRMSEAKERAVYFTISEGLANIAKHSGATSASVVVSRMGTMVHAEISDDGRGGAQVVPRHGLAGLNERLSSVGGSLSIESNPSIGTRLIIDVPDDF